MHTLLIDHRIVVIASTTKIFWLYSSHLRYSSISSVLYQCYLLPTSLSLTIDYSFRIAFLRGLHSRTLKLQNLYWDSGAAPPRLIVLLLRRFNSTSLYRMNNKGLAVTSLSQALLRISSNQTARTSMRRSYGTPREYILTIIQHPPHLWTLSHELISNSLSKGC